jgi:hypothetical protein
MHRECERNDRCGDRAGYGEGGCLKVRAGQARGEVLRGLAGALSWTAALMSASLIMAVPS